jgi:hypothetical protein
VLLSTRHKDRILGFIGLFLNLLQLGFATQDRIYG